MLKEVFLDYLSFKTIFAALGGCAGWLLGGFDVTFLALVILYLTDFLLGLRLAWYAGQYSSRKFRKGLVKAVLYMVVIMSAHMLDIVLGEPLPFLSNYARDFMVIFISVNEFLSVCRHLGAMGMRLPAKLIAKLENFQREETNAS